MQYDWLAQAYASGPTMTKEGKRHRAKYLRHWAKRMKPEDPVDTAHIEALAEEEEREKARIAAEKLAIDAARKARDAEESEWEEVPYEGWKIGDKIETTMPLNSEIPSGSICTISDLSPDSVGNPGVNVEECPINNPGEFGWPKGAFRLRRRKTKLIEVDLSKAAGCSKWMTRGGWSAKLEATDHAGASVQHGPLHGGSWYHKLDGKIDMSDSGRDGRARDYDIIAPWNGA